jgi:N-acetylglucosamine kinase-like BadF-type ATPase
MVYLIGDEGSGYWISRAVLCKADQRGPATVLPPLLLAHLGVARAQRLIHKVTGAEAGRARRARRARAQRRHDRRDQ